jgi:hypothetical protein
MLVPAGAVEAEKVILTSLLVLVAVAEGGVLGGGNGTDTEPESLEVGLSPPPLIDQTLKVYVDPRLKEEYVRSLLEVVSTFE